MRLKNALQQSGWLLSGCAGLLCGCGAPSGLPASGTGMAAWTVAGVAPGARAEDRFPDRALVAQIGPGLRDADLLRWFGAPDAVRDKAEGGSEAWEYIFHFRSGGGVTTCRCRVLLDPGRAVRGFHWQPSACGDWLSVKTPVQAQGKAAP